MLYLLKHLAPAAILRLKELRQDICNMVDENAFNYVTD